MVERTKKLKKPSGLSRFLFRLPIPFYRIHLGWLLGERILMLTHTGRKTGLTRQTIIEVVTKDTEQGVYYVTAAWGNKADWWLNLQANPHCTVDVGRKHFDAFANQVTPEKAGDLLLVYSRQHPNAMRDLARFLGFRVDGSEEQYRDLGRQLIIVALKPV